MLYFPVIKSHSKSNRFIINKRKSNREEIFPGIIRFNVGDVIMIFFWVRGLLYKFEGICICVRKKSINNINTSLILRNVLTNIGVEICISYFCNRLFSLKILDYKRKKFIYKRAKLYYLRIKLNRISRV